jgi:hypothetical protein
VLNSLTQSIKQQYLYIVAPLHCGEGKGEGVTFFEKRKLRFIFTSMHEDLKDKLFYNSNKGIFNNANALRKNQRVQKIYSGKI